MIKTDVLLGIQVRHLLEVSPPEPARYIVGAVIMMLGVVLPVGYMMFRTKRMPSSSGYAKQTDLVDRQRAV
ncbi:hypothetical protein M758_5G089700 [Ceratodon purpureus]|nr:hypothetical protein M758_5G089700 [Ceratodon purpureus]